MRYKRNWQGTIINIPADPDLVLSRHLRWIRPVNSDYSTLNGDEPDSITSASAWARPMPMSSIGSAALIYKDPISGMWIQAVTWRQVNKDQSQAWCQEQLRLGASATWFNHGSRPHRYRKTMAEQELSKINAKELTYVDLITEQGLLQFGDIDFTVLMPRARRRDVEYHHDAYPKTAEKIPKVKQPRTMAKTHSQPTWKPVRTPLGVFRSISEASISHDITPPGMNARIRNPRMPEYYCITQAEYEIMKNSISKNSQGEDFQTQAINIQRY
jgi:hypothetical protein